MTMGFQQDVKRESDAAKALLGRYQRVVWGRDGYRERVRPYLTMAAEFTLSQRRNALIDEEHSQTWVRGKP